MGINESKWEVDTNLSLANAYAPGHLLDLITAKAYWGRISDDMYGVHAGISLTAETSIHPTLLNETACECYQSISV